MKKILVFLVLPVMLLLLIGCGNEEKKMLQAAVDGIVINNIDEITENITLPASGLNDVKFSWTSDLPAVISNDGIVRRPTKEQGNQVVQLTVVATLNETTLTKVFTVTVLYLDYVQILNNAKTALSITFSLGEDSTNVKNRLTLPTSKDNVTVSWSSSHPSIISNTGVVNRPVHTVGNTEVTLTATLTLGSHSQTKEFKVLVIAHIAPNDREPSLDEKFDYQVGTLLDNTSLWSVAKGGEAAVVVDSVPNNIMPANVKALKITERGGNETHYDTPIEVIGNTVIEFLFLQEDGAASVSLEAWAGGRIFSVGLLRDGRFEYRVAGSTQAVDRSVAEITPYTWYKARVEIYPETNKYKYFLYNYNNTQNPLIELTPNGGVDFSATGTISTFRIRSVGSTVVSDHPNTYLANIIVNTIEALPVDMGTNPNMTIGIGEVTGIQNQINITTADTFVNETPVVKNRFNGAILVKDTDYTLSIDSNVVNGTDGTYLVKYTITNLHDSRDVKVVETTVIIALVGAPVIISNINASHIITTESTVTITLDKISGTLYYVKSDVELTAQQIKDSVDKVIIEVTNVEMVFTLIAENLDKIYVVIENEYGFSNVVSVVIITLEESNKIRTAEDLNALANSGGTGSYTLDNDIDFTNFTWNYDAKTFKGTLDGKGYKISNLNFTAPAGMYAGLFKELDGATIKNITFENVNLISTNQRAGILAGRTTGALVTIDNITIKNSKVTVGSETTQGDDIYGALLIGRATGDAEISNIKVVASEVFVNGKYTGGLIGYAEKILTMTDIDAEVKVTEVSTNPQLAGGIVGRVGSAGNLTLSRVIAKVDLTAAKNVGGLLGKNDGIATVTDALVTGKLSCGNQDSGAISGNKAFNTTVNVWAAALIGEGTGINKQSTLESNNLPSIDTVSVASWWTANMPQIASSTLWDIDGFASLIREVIVKHTISLVAEGLVIDPISVKNNTKATLPQPVKTGYTFEGWFTDSEFVSSFDVNTLITGDLTLYAKFLIIVLPQYDVVFDTKGGSLVVAQKIVQNETATKPTDPTREGYSFVGWFTDDSTYLNEFAFTNPISQNITLYAKWIELYTINFVVNGGQVVDPQQVKSGDKMILVTPIRTGYDFAGWFIDFDLLNEFNVDSVITTNLTLYAKWTEKPPTNISTASEFIDFLNNPIEGKYNLTADLDLTGLSYTPKTFKGVLDGKGYTISNLTVTIPTLIYGGLFKELDGATIKNINFYNIQLTSVDQRAGIIAGRTTGTTSSTIENITIRNSKVTIGSETTYSTDMYGALLIGRATTDCNISNIKVVASEVLVNGKYAGGLVGYAEKNLSLTDIDAEVKVTEVSTSTSAQMVGGIVGRVGSSGNLTLTRVVAKVNLTGYKNVGGLIGKNDGIASVTDALVSGTLTCTNADSGALSGNKVFNNLSNAWAVAVIGEGSGTNKQSANPENTLSSLDTVSVLSWWSTNMPNIAQNSLWDTDGFATIIRGEIVKYTVTIVAEGFGISPKIVRANEKVYLPLLEKDGYTFEGWFTDSFYTISFNKDTLINNNLTVYALFEEIAAPMYDVIFDSKSGSVVLKQEIVENALALEPIDPTLEGYSFAGWFTDDVTFLNEFLFTTPITSNITLYAKWLEIFTVDFVVNGGDLVISQQIIDGDKLTPVTPLRNGYDFEGWFIDSDLITPFDINSSVTSDITLYAAWKETPPIEITTAQGFIDFLNDPQTKTYLLMADIDLTGLTYTPKSFAGKFDGQGHTISNLTYNATGRAGLFTYLRGEFKNVIFNNISISSTNDRAGIIAGEIDAEGVIIENIIITNSSVAAVHDNGAGSLVGLVTDLKGGVTINKVKVENVTVTNLTKKNCGGLIGYVRGSGATIINDVQLKGVTITANEHVGGIIGYVNNPLSFTLNRAVLENISITGNVNYAAGIVGRCDKVGTMTDVLMKDITITTPGSYKNTVTGRNTLLTLTNIYGGNITIDTTSQGQTVTNQITDFAILDEAWYLNNLPSLISNHWNYVLGLPNLIIFTE